jgi:hypothetical protein
MAVDTYARSLAKKSNTAVDNINTEIAELGLDVNGQLP